MLHVRTARVDDADAVAQAHVQGWRVGYRGLFPAHYLDSPEFERERVERSRAFYEKTGWRATGCQLMWQGPKTAAQPPHPVAEVQFARS